jgi:siroheme decarboxylase
MVNAMTIEQHLLNDYQHNFPLISMPYSHIADELNTDTQTVLELLNKLNSQGEVSRVGPVFRPNTIGNSTLAAMSVPTDRLTEIATLVNAFSEVNHNYEREHHLNLWFVVTASDRDKVNKVLDDIQEKSGYAVLNLPLLKEYHIDLGFRMDAKSQTENSQNDTNKTINQHDIDLLHDEQLIAAIQAGLPLTEKPYFEIGEQLGISEQEVITKISDLQMAGIIRRMGVVVRHHELGYRANAMLVWDVPDDKVDELGRKLGAENEVTLCYQRPRIKPRWPYNLFSMIHGKNRDDVLACIERLVKKLALDNTPYEILFSRQRFKQCGAHYIAKDKALL